MKNDYKYAIINISLSTNFRTIEKSLSHTENRNNCWNYYLLTRMYFNYDVKKEYLSRYNKPSFLALRKAISCASTILLARGITVAESARHLSTTSGAVELGITTVTGISRIFAS